MKYSDANLYKIIKDIYIKNNKHWLSKEKLEYKWIEGTAIISKKDCLEAMKQIIK